MATRKKTGSVRSSAAKPFNNPFARDLRKLKRRLRDSSMVAPRKPTAPSGKASVCTDKEKSRSDADEFLDAVGDSVPLKGKSRCVRASARIAGGISVRELRTDFTSEEHFDIRFSDRYIRANAEGVSRQTVDKLARGEFAVRSHVDLHGMALDDAKEVVDEFIAERQRFGERCLLVITGKGRNSRHQVGVLREKIPEWLARGPSARRLLAFVTARPCDGGEGALYVLLRRRAARKTRIDVVAGGGA